MSRKSYDGYDYIDPERVYTYADSGVLENKLKLLIQSILEKIS